MQRRIARYEWLSCKENGLPLCFLGKTTKAPAANRSEATNIETNFQKINLNSNNLMFDELGQYVKVDPYETGTGITCPEISCQGRPVWF